MVLKQHTDWLGHWGRDLRYFQLQIEMAGCLVVTLGGRHHGHCCHLSRQLIESVGLCLGYDLQMAGHSVVTLGGLFMVTVEVWGQSSLSCTWEASLEKETGETREGNLQSFFKSHKTLTL